MARHCVIPTQDHRVRGTRDHLRPRLGAQRFEVTNVAEERIVDSKRGEAAKRLGVARQTVLHKVQRGELHAIQVTNGQRNGLRIKVSGDTAGLFDQ